MSSTELSNTWSKLSSITKCAKNDPGFEFMSLAHHLNKEFLEDCYKSLGRNKAVGIDKVSLQAYGKNMDKNLESLVLRLKRKSFRPLPTCKNQ